MQPQVASLKLVQLYLPVKYNQRQRRGRYRQERVNNSIAVAFVVVPEHCTRVPKYVARAHLMFALNKNMQSVGTTNGALLRPNARIGQL